MFFFFQSALLCFLKKTLFACLYNDICCRNRMEKLYNRLWIILCPFISLSLLLLHLFLPCTFPWCRLLLPGNLSDEAWSSAPASISSCLFHFSCYSALGSYPLKCQAAINNQSDGMGGGRDSQKHSSKIPWICKWCRRVTVCTELHFIMLFRWVSFFLLLQPDNKFFSYFNAEVELRRIS